MKQWLLASILLSSGAGAAQTIVCPPDAPANVKLAAKEVRRYIYLRTGELLPLETSGKGIALGVDPALGAQEYRLKTEADSLRISGGSDVAVVYDADNQRILKLRVLADRR